MKSTNFSFKASSFLLLSILVSLSFAQIGEGGIGVLPKLPCQDQFEALDICHSSNNCEECKILQFSNPFTSGFCGSLNEGLCQADGCCDSCEDDFNRYETCLLNLNLILCEINCAANVGDDNGNDNVVVIEEEPSLEESEEEEVISITLNPTSSPTMSEGGSLTEELEEKGCFEKFGEFGSCTIQNPLECGLCFITNIPLPDSIGNINDFCPVAEESICGFGQCCDSCSEEFTAFSECFSDVVDDITFGTCNLDCNDDDNGEDATTIDDCANSFTEYSSCIATNLFSCALCVIDALPDDGNDSSDDDGGLDALCQDTKDIVCTFGGCCTPCEQEFTKLELCLEVASNIITVGQCDFDCDENTEAPTASPTDDDEEDGGGFFDFGCFSSYNYVRALDVNDNTIVTKMMKELRIGDMVQSSNTDGTKMEFSRLYSFGHYAPKTKQEYLQIYTTTTNKPLEITKDHMVYVVNKKGEEKEIIPIPASTISIGDELVSGGNKGRSIVTKISTKLRNDGVYAPFTESGTILVNDILASNYISLFDHDDTELYNNKYMHWLAHAYQVPHRIWYYFNTEEHYTSDGISYWVYYPLQWSTKYYFHNNNDTSFLLKFMVYSIAHILYGIETLFRIATETTTTTAMLFTLIGGIVTMIIGKKSPFS